MTSKSFKLDDSPLKPIPINELFRMLNFGKPNSNSLQNVEEISSNHPNLNVSLRSINLPPEENEPDKHDDKLDYYETNEYHDLFPIKENRNSYANDSGYSSTTNRTNFTSSGRLSMANITGCSTGIHEVSSRKQDFLTPAHRPHPLLQSSVKSTRSSIFEDFLVPNKTGQRQEVRVQSENVEKEINPDKVAFQYTPSSKLQKSNSKIIRKPFIPKVVKANAASETDKNNSISNMLNDISTLEGNACEFISIKQSKYIKGNLIGRGGSCQVYHCFDPMQKVSRAIKIVNLKQNEDTVVLYRNEVKLLQNLQSSDRIIKLYDHEIVESEGLLYMVLEIGGKDIDKILKQLSANTSNLPFYKILYYWMEMLYCVRDIHKNAIVHSDLKPANFLMAENGIKLIDFGIASHLQTDLTSVQRTSAVGSLNYISPEALRCDNVTSKYKVKFKSDIWSLGCILYQLVYKKAPFQHIKNMWSKMEAITNKNHQIEYPPANWIPQNILGTIKTCLQFDANSRPTIDELITEYEHFNFT